MTQEALKLALEALEEAWYHVGTFQPTEKAIDLYDEARTAIKEALAQTQEPNDGYCKACDGWKCTSKAGCVALDNPPKTAQEPVAHLWECIGRWSAYLVSNGVQADFAPPSWLVEAVNNATAPPQRTWVGLTDDEELQLAGMMDKSRHWLVAEVEAKLKEKNT